MYMVNNRPTILTNMEPTEERTNGAVNLNFLSLG